MAFNWQPLSFEKNLDESPGMLYRLTTEDGYTATVMIADCAGWDVDVRHNDGKTPWHYRETGIDLASIGKEIAEEWIQGHRDRTRREAGRGEP